MEEKRALEVKTIWLLVCNRIIKREINALFE
jgi:hypothetical protein